MPTSQVTRPAGLRKRRVSRHERTWAGQRSDPAIPPIGAPDSLPGLEVQGPEGIAQRRAAGAPLTTIPGKASGSGAGGMATFCNPRTAADVAARCPCGRPRGLSARRRRRGPKGQRKAAGARRVTVPSGGQPAAGGCRAAQESARPSRGASQDRWPRPGPGAPGAPLIDSEETPHHAGRAHGPALPRGDQYSAADDRMVKSCGRRVLIDHAPTLVPASPGRSMSTPFSNFAPARTSATRCGPLT
jgi:hypothetical protein